MKQLIKYKFNNSGKNPYLAFAYTVFIIRYYILIQFS